MIDLHCHFLPGVDDGARTMEDALLLAAAAVADGISHAVLTPHVHPGLFDNGFSTLLRPFHQYEHALRQAGSPLKIFLGAEVRLHPDVFDLLATNELPVLGELDGARILLLELPDGQIPVGAMMACRHFLDKGIRPLIAHPERNKEVMRDPARILPFLEAGCMLQLTAGSIVGRFGRQAMDVSHQFLAGGLVDVVATDSHNLTHRPPMLQEARDVISELYGFAEAARLTEETPAKILASRRQHQSPASAGSGSQGR